MRLVGGLALIAAGLYVIGLVWTTDIGDSFEPLGFASLLIVVGWETLRHRR